MVLLMGMIFGILGGIQYLVPNFIKEALPFNIVRPLHVTSVISWIILAATGGIYYYLSESITPNRTWFSWFHFAIFILAGILILYSYATSNFGGKEYLEFPPALILPVLAGWAIFGIYYFGMAVKIKNWPVYNYMWATGIALMIYHLVEAYLWMHPSVGGNFIKSLTVQWKAGGSFVGAWNMLVYGTAIYLMTKIGPNDTGRTKTAFFFYFLGLTNLMFGWAHHIYIVPSVPYIRAFSYGISMTEWIILFHMIYQWRNSLPAGQKPAEMSSTILATTDLWIFLNLILALLFSIPAINYFTHGTHITVAHSMGTTIGINTTILLASLVYIARKLNPNLQLNQIRLGFRIFNLSLVFFWLCLLGAGAKKSFWMYAQQGVAFQVMQHGQYYFYLGFLLFGIGIFAGLLMMALPLLKGFLGFTATTAEPLDAASPVYLRTTRFTYRLRPFLGRLFQSEKVE